MKSTIHKKMTGFKAFLMAALLLLSTMVPQFAVQAAPNEVAQAALGIDVSRYQGAIDWNQSGSFRCSVCDDPGRIPHADDRCPERGSLCAIQSAGGAESRAEGRGIFFSAAVNEAEAVEEAVFTANLIDKYQITFPVAYDCEGFRNATSRQFGLGRDVRTALAVKFLDTIAARGYTPMFYASRNEMTDSADWNMNILNRYKVWVAQYPAESFPVTPASTYTGVQAMWQYTQSAVIPGIAGSVDMNVSYFNYDGIAAAKDPGGAALVSAENAANVQYLDVNEVVTPNTTVNLRTAPGTDDPATIVIPINPGDMVFRTGIGNNGWSRVLLNDQVLYAYTAYLQKVM